MGNIGGMEVVVVLLLALIVLGPQKLPVAARQVGRAINEIKRISRSFQDEMRATMQEPMQEPTTETKAKSARLQPPLDSNETAPPNATEHPHMTS